MNSVACLMTPSFGASTSPNFECDFSDRTTFRTVPLPLPMPRQAATVSQPDRAWVGRSSGIISIHLYRLSFKNFDNASNNGVSNQSKGCSGYKKDGSDE